MQAIRANDTLRGSFLERVLLHEQNPSGVRNTLDGRQPYASILKITSLKLGEKEKSPKRKLIGPLESFGDQPRVEDLNALNDFLVIKKRMKQRNQKLETLAATRDSHCSVGRDWSFPH